MPDSLTPDETRLIEALMLKLRMSQGANATPTTAPPMTWWQRYGSAIMGGMFALMSLFISLSWNENSKSNEALALTLNGLKDTIAKAAAKTDQNSIDIARNEGETKQLTLRLEQGQGQRIENDKIQAAKSAAIEQTIAVMASKQDNFQETLNWIRRKLEEGGKRSDLPFAVPAPRVAQTICRHPSCEVAPAP